jgi:hypothetical protein
MPLFSGFTSLFSSAPTASGAHGRKQSRSAAFMRSTDDAFARQSSPPPPSSRVLFVATTDGVSDGDRIDTVPTHDRPYGMDEPSRVSLGVGLQDGFGFGDSRPGSPALPSNALINVSWLALYGLSAQNGMGSCQQGWVRMTRWSRGERGRCTTRFSRPRLMEVSRLDVLYGCNESELGGGCGSVSLSLVQKIRTNAA